MSALFVGVDISGNSLRVAVLDAEKKPTRVVALNAASFADEEELAGLLAKTFTEDFPRPRRVVAAVPARQGFFRRLEFPFGDARKISSALAFELGNHLAIEPLECLIDFQPPKAAAEGRYLVAAAAVPQKYLENFLAPFEQAAAPLNTLDLAPFAFAAGLDEGLSNSLLACVNHEEVTVALVEEGQVVDYALQPLNSEPTDEELLCFIHSHSRFYQNRRGSEELPLCIIGSRAGAALATALEAQGHRVVTEPHGKLDGPTPEKEFLPAVLLALGATAKNRSSFNFRQGPLALKNDWSALKKQFIFSGVLAALALVALIATLVLNYIGKAGTLESLDKQIQAIYREALPKTKNDDNPLPRMKSHLIALEKKGAIFRIGRLPSPLEILKEISERLKDIADLDLRSYSYDPDNVRLEGTTTSFEAVNRMSSSLKESDFFREIEIAEAKMSLDGKHVNFRLRLTLKGGLTEP
ncbi:MAG: PilN domain-containing protein [Deltaproteobacteria bacterium]|nr:PilN domain-containing protein [Deltaproteobacteria bacterium]